MDEKVYLLRLDDACPTMDEDKWMRLETILDRYDIRPMVGVIPSNEDETQKICSSDPLFWGKVKTWRGKGWAIALHGYDHCYISNKAGINPLWNRSEFAGVSLQKQQEKIRKGVEIFRDNGIDLKYFFAPSHTFDNNTLEALRRESSIRIISDTIALKPYKENDFVFIPQIGGRCRKIPFKSGVFTFCLHPSTMDDNQFEEFENFLMNHHSKFASFEDLDFCNIGRKSVFSRLLSFAYFTVRKLKGI